MITTARAQEYIDLADAVGSILHLVNETIVAVSEGRATIEDIVDVQAMRGPIREMLVQIYTEVLTDEELDAVIAYRSSRVGRAIAAKQPLAEARAKAELPAIFERYRKP